MGGVIEFATGPRPPAVAAAADCFPWTTNNIKTSTYLLKQGMNAVLWTVNAPAAVQSQSHSGAAAAAAHATRSINQSERTDAQASGGDSFCLGTRDKEEEDSCCALSCMCESVSE